MAKTDEVYDFRLAAFKVAFIYAIFSILWILFSDQLVFFLIRDAKAITEIQTIKGWFFVFTSSLLIFFLLLKETNRHSLITSALRENETVLRSITDAAQDAVLVMTSEGKVSFWNPAAERIFGYRKDEALGRDLHILIAPKRYHVKYQKAFALFQKSGKGAAMDKTIELQGTRKDEREISIELSLSAVELTDGWYAVGVVRDISERKQAEEALRESERKLHAIFDHHYQLTGLIDNNGRLIAANRTALSIANAVESEVIGQYFWDGPWWEPSQRSELRYKVERAAKGEFVRFETTHPTADGQIRHIDFSLSPVWDDDGNVIYIVPEGRDITEVKRAEQEKLKLQQKLSQTQKMEAIGTLAGGVAHDFNNILSAIIGYTELSKLSLDNKKQLSDYSDNILKAGERAKDLIQQILTFSRQTEQVKKPTSVKLITKEALKLLRASLPTTIEIKQRLESDSLVMGDPTEIHQIVMNLCANAAHSMRDEGGTLEVVLADVHLRHDFTDSYPTIEPGPYLNLNVSDTGCGMSPDILNRVFDPFFTTKEQGEGTGMGLSVVHGVVESCGGIIHASSEPGKGSSFNVFLPVVSAVSEVEEKKETNLPCGEESILFVDDEPTLVEIGKTILQKLGYQVTTANNALDALEVFHANPDNFDLVITDMTMPKMTGSRFAKELISLRSDIPVILCTGFSTGVTEAKVKAMGIKGFLMKPIILREIAMLVRQVLDDAKKKTQKR